LVSIAIVWIGPDWPGAAGGVALPLCTIGPSAMATGPTATASTRTGTLPIKFQSPFFIVSP
jgi:hypothetical protein